MKAFLLRKSLIAIILVLTIISCKKNSNDNNPEFKGVFKQSNMINLSSPIMYTMNGQINDLSTIKSYLYKHPFDGLFNLNTQSEYSNAIFEANFKENGKVTWYITNQGITSSEYNITEKTSSGFILRATDSTRIFKDNGTTRSRSAMLIAYSNKINKISNCTLVPSANNISEVCTYKEALPFIITNGQLYLSLFSCSITSYTTFDFSSFTTGNVQGIFNTEIAKQLGVGDTVVVQSKTILFNKK